MVETLHIQLLGDFRLSTDDTALTTVNTPRLQSLLTYLLLHRDAAQARSHIAYQFWPDSTEAQACSNLRTLLHRLRRGLPEPDTFLDVDTQTIQWRPGAPFSLDLADLEAALARADDARQAGDEAGERAALARAVECYGGDLLPSCYDDWLLPCRERLLQSHLRALERLADLLEQQRAYDQALRYARRRLRLDPLHEAGYRRLMRLHALQGDRAGALRVYHTCATTLQHELGVEPGPATQRAYEDLLQAGARPAPTEAVPGLSPLVGREEEWAGLQTAWRRAARGPRFVLLLGEAGIGKTRLVEELLLWARRQGIASAYARSYAAEGKLAYAPLTALLQARPLPPLDDVWLSEIARLLPEVLAERPDLPPPQPMTEAWQRQRLFQALVRAVLGGDASRESLLLILEDLQWCDRSTLDWLHYLLRFDPGAYLLVVGTCRPEELDGDCPFSAALPVLHRDLRLTEIELGPLDEVQTATLAANVAGQALDAAAARRLYRETEGNPLFVVEVLRAGLSIRQEGPETEHVHLPPRAQAVLETRLAQLSPPARELAGLAATVGRSFAVAVLEKAGAGDEDVLVQGLDELWRRRIVRERGADAYDFTHDKLRETAYSLLSPARRRLLHRKVAQALEAIHALQPDAAAHSVAVHYDRAGLAESAIRHYLRAGIAANKIYAKEEAVASFNRGLALLAQGTWQASQRDWRGETAAELYEGLGDALQISQPGEARQAYQSAGQEPGRDDRLRQARLQRKIGATWYLQGEHDKALLVSEQCKALLGAEPFEPGADWWREWLLLQYGETNVLYALARWREIESIYGLIQPIVEEHGTATDRAWLCAGRVPIALRRDRYLISEATLADARASLSESQKAGDVSLIAQAQFILGWVLTLRGNLDEAEEILRAAVASSDQIKYMTWHAWSLLWLAVLCRRRGQVAENQRYASLALEVASTDGIPEQVAMAQANLAWVAWHEGDLDRAEELGHAALDSWRRGQWVYAFHWAARLPLLAMALERDQLADALEHARDMLDPQQQRLPAPLEAALEAAVQANEDQGLEARAHLERVVELAQELHFL